MNISIFTVVLSILVYAILIVAYCILSKSNFLIRLISPRLLNYACVAIMLRLIFPIEISFLSEIINLPIWISDKLYNLVNLKFVIWDFKIKILYVVLLIIFIKSLRLLWTFYKEYRKLSKLVMLKNEITDQRVLRIAKSIKDKNKYKFRTKIIVIPDIAVPIEFGLFTNIIILPEPHLLSDDEIYWILSHEFAHFATGGNWIKFFICILVRFFYIKPLSVWIEETVSENIEYMCDCYVARINNNTSIKYLDCILNLKKKSSKPEPKFDYSFCSNIFSSESLKRRFSLLLASDTKSHILSKIISIFIIVFVFLFSYKFIPQTTTMPPVEDIKPLSLSSEYKNTEYVDGFYNLYYDGKLFSQYSIEEWKEFISN